jgi:hypothetical protein
MEKALKNIKCLELVSKQDIKAFQCNKDEMVLIGVTTGDTEIDFNKDSLAEVKDCLDIFRTSKEYVKSREEEVFQLLESGCSIMDEERFNKLELAYLYSSKIMQN